MRSSKLKLLAVDDDPIWLQQVPLIFGKDFQVVTAGSIDEAFIQISELPFDIVLLDLNFGEIRDGMDVFRRIQAMDSAAEVILISGETNPARIMELYQSGVKYFVPKPASLTRLRAEVQRALEARQERMDLLNLMVTSQKGLINPFVGTSDAILRLKTQLEELQHSSVKDVLIQGETGTGKEVFARYLASVIAPDRKFIPIHCGALVESLVESELFGHKKGAFTGADRDRKGVFESAQGGVVFLDEIGEMPTPQQAKLLRVLQERTVTPVGSHDEVKVNFKTISATNRNLSEMIQEKQFREDLFFRVGRYLITLPALRDRKDDIPALILTQNLRTREGEPIVFNETAIQALKAYSWPGNIRELFNVIENIALRTRSSTVTEADVIRALPMLEGYDRNGEVLKVGTVGKRLLLEERNRFIEAIRRANGSAVEAAKILKISRATYFRRTSELGISRETIRRLL